MRYTRHTSYNSAVLTYLMSVSAEEISRVYLIFYISEYWFIESVCEDDVALGLEGVKVINDFATEEFAAVFECWLVDDDRNSLTDNRIKDIIICMQRWFRALPQAARNITNNSDYDVDESLLRKMTALKRELQSVEYNPFETLFITLPNEFGTADNLESTYLVIDECKTAYDD